MPSFNKRNLKVKNNNFGYASVSDLPAYMQESMAYQPLYDPDYFNLYQRPYKLWTLNDDGTVKVNPSLYPYPMYQGTNYTTSFFSKFGDPLTLDPAFKQTYLDWYNEKTRYGLWLDACLNAAYGVVQTYYSRLPDETLMNAQDLALYLKNVAPVPDDIIAAQHEVARVQSAKALNYPIPEPTLSTVTPTPQAPVPSIVTITAQSDQAEALMLIFLKIYYANSILKSENLS